MSGPHQQPFSNRQSASENGASDNPAPRVDFLPDGKVRMTYASYTDYARDQKLGTSHARLRTQRTERR